MGSSGQIDEVQRFEAFVYTYFQDSPTDQTH